MLKRVSFDEWNNLQTKSSFDEEKVNIVKAIISNVKTNKDNALREYTKAFDGVTIENFRVSEEEIEYAYNTCDSELILDLKIAYQNILDFHQRQLPNEYQYDIGKNSFVGQKYTAIEEVGIYVPGGTAAYPSTVLMNAAPAKIAGVKRIVMISPPGLDGTISPIILTAAKVAGITEIYKVGGAQGVAALAYGTESIKPVYKIVGPGNIYVALAKKEVFGKVGIDMIAGPSEILVYADECSNPAFVAADLLSQAEHDTLARPLLICNNNEFIDKVELELQKQLDVLPRKDFASIALEQNGYAIIVDSEIEAIKAINTIAPEHLELLVENAEEVSKKIINAGAIFIGSYCPEPLGDYIAGPNHTLPTSGTATFSSALGVYDFIKRISIISYTKEGLLQYRDSVIRLAEIEGLQAHANAVKVRFNDEN